MGRTNRHERTEGRRFKKLKGRNASRNRNRKDKTALSNFVSFRSEREDQRHIPNDETLEALRELEVMKETSGPECICGRPMKDCLGFETVEEMLEELNEPDEA